MTEIGVSAKNSLLDQASNHHFKLGLVISALVGLGWILLPSPLLILAVGVIPFAAYLVLSQPFVTCLAFIALSFFRLHEAFPPLYPLHIPFMLAVVAIGVLGIHLMTGSLKPRWSTELTIFSLFALHVTMGIFFSTNRQNAFDFWKDNFSRIIIMVPAIIWLIRDMRDLALAAKTFIACGSIIAIVALWNATHGIGLVEGTRVTIGRDLGSLLGDPNDLALVLLFPLSFAGTYITAKSMALRHRLFGFIGIILILAAIIATGSRGGLLGVVAVMAAFGARRIKSKTLLAVLAGLAIVVLWGAAGIADRASGGAAEQGVDASANGRLLAWGAAWRMALTYPFFGVGLNNFSGNFYFFTTYFEGLAKAVHSTWFGILAEGGFPGFFLFLLLVIYTARNNFLTMRFVDRARARGVIRAESFAMAEAQWASLAGFIVSGSFLTQHLNWPIYILLALSVSTRRMLGLADQGQNDATPETDFTAVRRAQGS